MHSLVPHLSLTSSQRLLLLILLILWGALLFGGFLLGTADARRTHRMPLWTRLSSSVVLVLAGWWWFVYRGQKATPLHWSALFYALLLASTAGFATSLAVQQDASFVLLAVGATLFLLSDLILAGELFSDLHFPYIGDVVWLTLGPAQKLIVYSVGIILT